MLFQKYFFLNSSGGCKIDGKIRRAEFGENLKAQGTGHSGGSYIGNYYAEIKGNPAVFRNGLTTAVLSAHIVPP